MLQSRINLALELSTLEKKGVGFQYVCLDSALFNAFTCLTSGKIPSLYTIALLPGHRDYLRIAHCLFSLSNRVKDAAKDNSLE